MTKPNVSVTSPRAKWWALAGVCLGVMMYTLDGSIVNIAVPTFLKVFNTDLVTVQWTIIGYLLVIVCGLLVIAQIANQVGQKRIFLAGLGLFTLGSLLCGLAPNIQSLIGFRLLQGLGAVCMAALMSSIVVRAFPAQELGQALGFVTTAATVGSSLGPSLGGFLISTWSWRGIFLVNLPLGLLGIALVLKALPPDDAPVVISRKFDGVGFVLMSVSLVSLLLLILDSSQTHFSMITGFLLGGLSLISFGSFLWVEKRQSVPLLDLSVFQSPMVSIGLLGSFVAMAINAGYLFMIPLFLELSLHYSTNQAGLFLTMMTVLFGIMAPVSCRISYSYGVIYCTLSGLAFMGVGLWVMTSFSVTMTGLAFLWKSVPWSLGMGLFNTPNNSIVMQSVSAEKSSTASALFSLSIMFGQVIGVSILGASFHHFAVQASPLEAGQTLAQLPPTAITTGVTESLKFALVPVIGLILLNLRWQSPRQLGS